ncbi:MAG: transposase [Elusimicrobia bacterium]|nr:transposase [Elusimicrobiota bacterium]
MPRIKRLLFNGVACHIMARGNNRQTIFHDDQDFRFFLCLLRECKKEFPFEIFHYCLMPNHIHLVCRVLNATDFVKAMKKLFQNYSQRYVARRSYVGHVWQGRYKSLLIGGDRYLLACGRYIELNPVRAGLVRKPEDYPWSSYKSYVNETHDSLVKPSPLFETLGHTMEKRRVNYAKWVDEGLVSSQLLMRANFVGSRSSIRDMEKRLGVKGTALIRGRPKKKGSVPFILNA